MVEVVLSTLSKFKEAFKDANTNSRITCYYKPSPQYLIKINVDGAVSIKHKRLVIGMVIRDWKENLKVARVYHVDQMGGPFIIELLAIKEALLWCIDAGYKQGEISTYCKNACDLVYENLAFCEPDSFLV